MILAAWNVNDGELVAQGFLFQISQARVGDIIQVAVSKYFQEWLMIDRDNEVRTPDDKVSGFVQTLDDGKRFPFNGSVAGLGWRCKSAANQDSFPPIITAEWFVRGWTLTMLLVQPETRTSSAPIGDKACGSVLIKDLNSTFHFLDDYKFGLFEQLLELGRPAKFDTRLQEVPKGGHLLIGGECI